MTAPVRIETKAWTDSRFGSLAMRIGLQNPRFALILVAGVWRWQTEHYNDDEPTYIVHRAVVEGELLSLDGPESLVAANLAEWQPDGRLRIKGGRDDDGRSRIDWLWRSRQQRAAAGAARAAKAKTTGREGGRFIAAEPERATSEPPAGGQREGVGTSGGPAADQRDTSGAPALRTPDSGLRIPDVSLSVRAPASDLPAPPAEVPSGTMPAVPPVATGREGDLFATLAEELHLRHAEEARRLRVAIPGCANVSIGGGLLVGETRVAVLEAVSRWSAEARELGVDTREHVEARMNHLVAVRAATARRERHVRWWTPGRFWRWEGIEIDLAQTVQQVRERAREGARGSQDRTAPPPAAAPDVATTAAETERQREYARKAAAEREATAAELARAKAALGIADAEAEATEAKEAVGELRGRLAARAGGSP